MKNLKTFAIGLLILASCVSAGAQSAENLNLNRIVQPPYNSYGRLADGCSNAELLGWKVGVQFYTFNKYTFFEGIDLTRALGLHYIEANMGARITADSDQRISANMPQEWKDKIRRKLVESGVECLSFYCGMNGSGEGFEDIVKFAKEMGWMIVTDPKRADNGGKPVSFYEEILDKYGVKMVFTNHPKDGGAAYWNPDYTVADTQGYGKNIGASIDIGHYMRGGFDTYEIARRYIGIDKLYHFHMRDVSERGPHGLDVPCGTGQARVGEIFNMMNDTQVKPLIMLEYEHDFDNPLPYLIQSVNYINQLCGEIVKANEEKARLGDPVLLYADAAQISSDLRVQDSGAKSTIHDWSKPEQSISWTTSLKPGNYQVKLRYSQPFAGSAVTLAADGEELASLIPSTFTWFDFTEQPLGVIRITKGGQTTLTLKGIQNSFKRNRQNGRLRQDEALPDVNALVLVPTSMEATSQPVDIISRFKGVQIFDGKTFAGWEPNSDGAMDHFRIEKGAIVGGSLKADLEHNQFLRTTRFYRDFELHLKYKVVANDNTYNGGVQFRSVHSDNPRTPYEMYGYQADIMEGRIGALYDESRRNTFIGMALDAPERYQARDWNDMVIRCEGPRVRIWLNGVKTTDYMEPFTQEPYERIGTIAQDGYIAVQIHEGKASEVWYKDIYIQDLTPAD